MSGPKSADYYLSVEQRRILAEQRRVEELKKKISIISVKCTYSEAEVNEFVEKANELLKKNGTENGAIKLNSRLISIYTEMKNVLSESENISQSDALNEKYKRVKQLVKDKDSVISELRMAEQRKILAEQRRVEELKKKISIISVKCTYSEAEVNEFVEKANELVGINGEENEAIKLNSKLVSVFAEMKTVLSESENISQSDALNEKYKRIKQLVKEKDSVLSELRVAAMKNEAQLKEIYEAQLDKALEIDFGTIKSASERERDEFEAVILEMLDEILMTENLSESLRREIVQTKSRLKEFTDVSTIRNFNAITVIPLVKKCREYAVMFEEFEEIRISYEALCMQEKIDVQQFECSREGIENMKLVSEEIKRIADEADEQEYINQSIDEVMQDMGYSLIGTRSVVKKNGRKFRNELYTFDEGTAVNITYASDGKITMELGGLASEDRYPDGAETDLLCEKMQSFCTEFTEFERRLKEKGVLSKRIAMLPPTAEYAQIINTSDYSMTDNASFSEINARSSGSKAAKYMRTE